MTLDELNALDRDGFVEALAGVFEHSPWVAAAVVDRRPFASVDALHRAMCDRVTAAPRAQQLALIRAHPELAGKAALAGELTTTSAREQRGAGLDACTPEEFARLHALNAAYRERFGMPFVLAVRGLDRAAILEVLAARLHRPFETELAEALRQIERIAALRLADIITTPAR